MPSYRIAEVRHLVELRDDTFYRRLQRLEKEGRIRRTMVYGGSGFLQDRSGRSTISFQGSLRDLAVLIGQDQVRPNVQVPTTHCPSCGDRLSEISLISGWCFRCDTRIPKEATALG